MPNSTDCNGRDEHNPTRLLPFLTGDQTIPFPKTSGVRPVIGVLDGNGIGPEVVAATLSVLKAAEEAVGIQFEIRHGGPIGEQAEERGEKPLPKSVVEFCEEVFESDGAILNGPGGGRYVYDLRQQFDLFCKFVPVRPWPQLVRAGRIAMPEQVDLLLVRDNIGGVYQGQSKTRCAPEGRVVEHSFSYSESQIRRLVEVAVRAAARRRGRLHVIVKEGGVPAISALWREIGEAVAHQHGITVAIMNVDLAAYELIQHPEQFDVLVAPNLIGDILADIAGVLVASRGLTFSGNYNSAGHGVYQTNHGCAHDLAGKDTANPAGQILSLCMMLRESFKLDEMASLIETAMANAWAQGWRTPDIAEPGCHVLGTRAMADRIARQVSMEARQLA